MKRCNARCIQRLVLSLSLGSWGLALALNANSSQVSKNDTGARAVTIEDVVNAPNSSVAADGGVESLSWIGTSNAVVYSYRESAAAEARVEIFDTRRRTARIAAAGLRPSPSPDGSRIAFVASGDNHHAQLWIFESSTGRLVQLTQFPEGVFSSGSNNYEYSWSPDGSQILFAHHIGLHLAAARGGDYMERFGPDSATALVFDGKHHLREDTEQTEIWLINSRSGASRLVATERADMVAGIGWFPDGRRAAYFSEGISDVDGVINSLVILDTVSGVTRVFESDVGQDAIPHISPDGRYIAFDRNVLGISYPEYDSVSIVEVDTGIELKLPIVGATSRILAWTKGSDGLYVREKRDSSGVWHVEYWNLKGQKELLPALGQQSYIALSYFQRKAAWVDGDAAHPSLHVMALPISKSELRQTNIALSANSGGDSPLGRKVLLEGERRQLRWRSRDGTNLTGFLVLPIDYHSAQRYPTLVMIHGGAFGGRGEQAAMPLHTPLIFDYWAAKGFVVFAPNYRSDGSAGWNALLEARARGNLFDRDFDDIMTGVDELIHLGIGDANHLGILGHSYGSTETNWAITHTHRFRVAVSYEGEADMVWGLGGRMNAYDEWLYGGSPVEKRASYDRQSALRSVLGTTTPTLFVAGEFGLARDQLAWMYAALRRQGTPAEFVLYRNEGHNVASSANRLDVMKRVTDWIESHIE